MKSMSITCKSILVAAILLLAVSSWAENKGRLGLQHPTNVGGKTLATGNYAVRWEGTGDQVELKIYQGKTMVTSLPARVIQLSTPAGYDSAVVNGAGDNVPSLAEIRFGGKRLALRISGEGGGAGSSGASK